MVTIRDVAALSGVAKSTVSKVLNGGAASPAVARRVRAAVDQLGYSPSEAARALALGKAAPSSSTCEPAVLLSVDDTGVYGFLLRDIALRLVQALGPRAAVEVALASCSQAAAPGLLRVRFMASERSLSVDSARAAAEVFSRLADVGARRVVVVPCSDRLVSEGIAEAVDAAAALRQVPVRVAPGQADTFALGEALGAKASFGEALLFASPFAAAGGAVSSNGLVGCAVDVPMFAGMGRRLVAAQHMAVSAVAAIVAVIGGEHEPGVAALGACGGTIPSGSRLTASLDVAAGLAEAEYPHRLLVLPIVLRDHGQSQRPYHVIRGNEGDELLD